MQHELWRRFDVTPVMSRDRRTGVATLRGASLSPNVLPSLPKVIRFGSSLPTPFHGGMRRPQWDAKAGATSVLSFSTTILISPPIDVPYPIASMRDGGPEGEGEVDRKLSRFTGRAREHEGKLIELIVLLPWRWDLPIALYPGAPPQYRSGVSQLPIP
jgi:hypothetical protein